MKKIEKQLSEKYGNEILYSVTELRPVHVNGSGKWTRNYRSSKVHAQIDELKRSGLFHYETGNDAPKGGKCGEFHRFTPKIRRLALKRADDDRKKLDELRRSLAFAKFQKQTKERAKRIQLEFEAVKPFAIAAKDRIQHTKQLSGTTKNNAQASILKELLEKAGIEMSIEFWMLWRKVSRYVSDLS